MYITKKILRLIFTKKVQIPQAKYLRRDYFAFLVSRTTNNGRSYISPSPHWEVDTISFDKKHHKHSVNFILSLIKVKQHVLWSLCKSYQCLQLYVHIRLTCDLKSMNFDKTWVCKALFPLPTLFINKKTKDRNKTKRYGRNTLFACL